MTFIPLYLQLPHTNMLLSKQAQLATKAPPNQDTQIPNASSATCGKTSKGKFCNLVHMHCLHTLPPLEGLLTSPQSQSLAATKLPQTASLRREDIQAPVTSTQAAHTPVHTLSTTLPCALFPTGKSRSLPRKGLYDKQHTLHTSSTHANLADRALRGGTAVLLTMWSTSTAIHRIAASDSECLLLSQLPAQRS